MQHKLYKQNKLTNSDQSQTQLQLLRRPRQTNIDIPYSAEEISKNEEVDIDKELERITIAEDLQTDKLVEVTKNSNAMDFSEEVDDDPSLGLEPTQ